MTMAEAKDHVIAPRVNYIKEALAQVLAAQEQMIQTMNSVEDDKFPPTADQHKQTHSAPRVSPPVATPAVDQLIPLPLAIQAWAKAWRQQTPKAYLGHYADNFSFAEAGATSRNQWERLRTQRLTQYKSIELELTALRFKELAPGLVQVSFHQRWQADKKSPRTSNKLMTWQLRQKRWVILSERSQH